jgi:molybdate transport system regulatory protein
MSDYPKATLRISFAPDRRLGPGKIRLLELIGETGSISAAARGMEMSYRRAWLLVGELNAIFGAPVAEAATGGSGGGGAVLTPLGKHIVKTYRGLEQRMDTLVHKAFKAPARGVRRSKRP